MKLMRAKRPTIVERVVNLVPGPYILKCLVFWMIFGTPGMVLTRYLDTFSFDRAVAVFTQLTARDVFYFSMPNLVLPLYGFLGIGYMRSKIVQKTPDLETVAADGAKTLDGVFGSISGSLAAVVLAVLFGVVSITSFPGQTEHVAGVLSLIVKVVGFVFGALSYGTFVWMYASSIRGLYRLSKGQMRFVSFFEDSHLGTRPLGSISLSFALVYFFGVGLVFLAFNPVPTPILVASLGLILVGVAIFFLPLYTMHARMVKEKQAAEKALRKNLSRIMGSIERKEESANEITEIFLFQLLENKVSKISEWPFDTVTLSWFSAIVITVLGTIITRYVLVFLSL